MPGTPVTTRAPLNGSSIVSDMLYALDARTGQVRWSVPAAHLLAVLAPGLVIAQTPVGLVGLQADSGAPLWTHKTTRSRQGKTIMALHQSLWLLVRMAWSLSMTLLVVSAGSGHSRTLSYGARR
jgi:hypothetical protein